MIDCISEKMLKIDNILYRILNISTTQKYSRNLVPDELEYIFYLILHEFSFIDPHVNYYQVEDKEASGEKIEIPHFTVNVLPFEHDTDAENYVWNIIADRVISDFYSTKDNVRPFSFKELYEYTVELVDKFPFEDRERINANKLSNLLLFIYDFCFITYKESKLHQDLWDYMLEPIQIGNREVYTTRRNIDRFKEYLKSPNIELSEDECQVPNVRYDLPDIQYDGTYENPHMGDSYVSAMFIDLVHKFFNFFKIKKAKNAQYSSAEKLLLLELLRFFGFSKAGAKTGKSSYITTCANQYGDYFYKCKLTTWLRKDQAYEYLIGIKSGNLKEVLPNCRKLKVDFTKQVSPDIYEDGAIWGSIIKLSSGMHIPNLQYITILKDKTGEKIQPDRKLEYVKSLIETSFMYLAPPFFNGNLSTIGRQDLNNPLVWNQMVSELKTNLLDRVDFIPRGEFKSEDIKAAIQKGIRRFHSDDRKILNSDSEKEKLYYLFLFIYDYVILSYKEMALNPHLKKDLPSKIIIDKEEYTSTALIDQLFLEYIINPFDVSDKCERRLELRNPRLVVSRKSIIDEHPLCNSSNMIAMFYDLFQKFFRGMNLKKRSNATLSEAEKLFIADLATEAKLCEKNPGTNIAAMYAQHKNYFEEGKFFLCVRDNEFGRLMIRDYEEAMFGKE